MAYSNTLSILEDLLGRYKVSGSSQNEIHFCCPFCILKRKKADTSFKLYLNLENEGFICFKCETKGWGFNTLLKLLKNDDGIAIDCYKSLAYDSIVSNFKYGDSRNGADKIDTKLSFEECGLPSYKLAFEDYSAYRYLRVGRSKLSGGKATSIDDDKILFYKIGITPNYPRRVIIPTFDDNDNLIYYVARSIISTELPKYKNPSGNIFKKTDKIFNLNNAKFYSSVIITEGVFSSIAVGYNGVATFGKGYSRSQVHILASYNFNKYYVAYDGDALDKGIKLCEDLSNFGKNVYFVEIPKDQDPDSLVAAGIFQDALDSAYRYSKLNYIKNKI